MWSCELCIGMENNLHCGWGWKARQSDLPVTKPMCWLHQNRKKLESKFNKTKLLPVNFSRKWSLNAYMWMYQHLQQIKWRLDWLLILSGHRKQCSLRHPAKIIGSEGISAVYWILTGGNLGTSRLLFRRITLPVMWELQSGQNKPYVFCFLSTSLTLYLVSSGSVSSTESIELLSGDAAMLII